jgi:hypothetical protein
MILSLKAFDEKLAKLGYHANSGKQKRSHHKAPATAVGKTPAKPKFACNAWRGRPSASLVGVK